MKSSAKSLFSDSETHSFRDNDISVSFLSLIIIKLIILERVLNQYNKNYI